MENPKRGVWFGVLLCALLGASYALAMHLPEQHPDFASPWAATRGGNPYDLAVITAHLRGVVTPDGVLLFGYLPPSLPIFGLFGLLPFRAAMVLWCALSAGTMAIVTRSRWSPALMLTPATLYALIIGQTSVLMGALLYGALLTLEQPLLAGLLLGVALAIKPQIAGIVFLAIAFLAILGARHWRLLFTATGVFLALSVLSALIYGPAMWLRWAGSLSDFLQVAHSDQLGGEIAPFLPTPVRLVALLLGAAGAAWAIRRRDLPCAFVIAGAGALLASPHAIAYELALFSPALIALFKRDMLTRCVVLAFVFAPAGLTFLAGIGAGRPSAWALMLLSVVAVRQVIATRAPLLGEVSVIARAAGAGGDRR